MASAAIALKGAEAAKAAKTAKAAGSSAGGGSSGISGGALGAASTAVGLASKIIGVVQSAEDFKATLANIEVRAERVFEERMRHGLVFPGELRGGFIKSGDMAPIWSRENIRMRILDTTGKLEKLPWSDKLAASQGFGAELALRDKRRQAISKLQDRLKFTKLGFARDLSNRQLENTILGQGSERLLKTLDQAVV